MNYDVDEEVKIGKFTHPPFFQHSRGDALNGVLKFKIQGSTLLLETKGGKKFEVDISDLLKDVNTVTGAYDESKKAIVFEHNDGSTFEVPVGDLLNITVDEKSITGNGSDEPIKVKLSAEDGNILEIKDDGLFAKDVTVESLDLDKDKQEIKLTLTDDTEFVITLADVLKLEADEKSITGNGQDEPFSAIISKEADNALELKADGLYATDIKLVKAELVADELVFTLSDNTVLKIDAKELINPDIADDLVTDDSDIVLSAKQGVRLRELIEAVEDELIELKKKHVKSISVNGFEEKIVLELEDGTKIEGNIGTWVKNLSYKESANEIDVEFGNGASIILDLKEEDFAYDETKKELTITRINGQKLVVPLGGTNLTNIVYSSGEDKLTYTWSDGTEKVIILDEMIAKVEIVNDKLVTTSSLGTKTEIPLTFKYNIELLEDDKSFKVKDNITGTELTDGKKAKYLVYQDNHNTSAGQDSGTGGSNTTNFGEQAGQNFAKNFGTNIGKNAGKDSAGDNQTTIGALSGQKNTKVNAVIVGFRSAESSTSVDHSVVIGMDALRLGDNLKYSNLIGHQAGSSSNRMVEVDGFGQYSLRKADNIGLSCFFGNRSGIKAKNIRDSEGFGAEALRDTDGINRVTALGKKACGSSKNVSASVYAGFWAGLGNLDINTTTGIGYASCRGLKNSKEITALGGHALDAYNNEYINLENVTCIGYNAKPSSNDGVKNEITLGDNRITVLRCNTSTISALSDGRDKKNIKDLEIGLNFVNAIKPRHFEWDTRDGSRVDEPFIGFIAQELLEVSKDKEGLINKGLVNTNNPDRFEVGESALIPILVKAIQELTARVESLEYGHDED